MNLLALTPSALVGCQETPPSDITIKQSINQSIRTRDATSPRFCRVRVQQVLSSSLSPTTGVCGSSPNPSPKERTILSSSTMHIPQHHRYYYNTLASSECLHSLKMNSPMLWIQHFKILSSVVKPSDNEGTVGKKCYPS